MIQINEIVENVVVTVEDAANNITIQVFEEVTSINIEIAEMGLQGIQGEAGVPLVLQDLPPLP